MLIFGIMQMVMRPGSLTVPYLPKHYGFNTLSSLIGNSLIMPGGRPKITTANFPDDWKELIISEMKLGASKMEIYAMLDISDVTFARIMREDKEFFRTIKKGERLSQAWWEGIGRKYLKDKDFNYTGWYMNMKNRFNWADKTESRVKTDVNVSTADPKLAKEFAAFLKDNTKA